MDLFDMKANAGRTNCSELPNSSSLSNVDCAVLNIGDLWNTTQQIAHVFALHPEKLEAGENKSLSVSR